MLSHVQLSKHYSARRTLRSSEMRRVIRVKSAMDVPALSPAILICRLTA